MNNQPINIDSEFWQFILDKKPTNKTASKIYKWLNQDNLGSITLDRGVFWIEKVNSTTVIPNYVYYAIKQWGIRQGYQYLYDLK